MTTIFEALRSDHEIQRKLIEDLVETTGASDERLDGFKRLRDELTAHADNEERYFYVPLMLDDLTQDKARHSVAEHKELDDLVEQLEEYEMGASQWLTTARELKERLIHHLDEEEHEVFQLAGKSLDESQKADLAVEYREAMDEARRK